jgi:uncharacterized protein GlcG (DUF336 family)
VSSSEVPAQDPRIATEVRAGLGEIPWRLAREMIDHVLADAERRGLRVAVALIDRWGRQLAFQRQPGTVMASSAVAIGKALAASTFDAPTRVLVETISRRDQEELGRANPGLVFAGGGFPIRAEGLLAGGIGVSGASADQDTELALGALAQAGFDVDFGEQTDREEGGDG